mgnify:CR=1 FL=1
MSEQNGKPIVVVRKKQPQVEAIETPPDFPIVEWDLLDLTGNPKQSLFFSPMSITSSSICRLSASVCAMPRSDCKNSSIECRPV